jgi:hypothetical protein
MSRVTELLRRHGLMKPKVQPPMDKAAALRVLAEARDLLAALGVRAWLTDGTLLGYHRERDFIGHDQDVDLGCAIAAYDDRIIERFAGAGLECTNVFGRRDCGLELSFRKDGVSLDLFFFYEEGARRWHGAWRRTRDGRRKRRNLIKYYYDAFGLAEVEFKGERFLAPEDVERYVVTKYGEGWRTPVKGWDWAFGPANAVATDVVLDEARPPFNRASVT